MTFKTMVLFIAASLLMLMSISAHGLQLDLTSSSVLAEVDAIDYNYSGISGSPDIYFQWFKWDTSGLPGGVTSIDDAQVCMYYDSAVGTVYPQHRVYRLTSDSWDNSSSVATLALRWGTRVYYGSVNLLPNLVHSYGCLNVTKQMQDEYSSGLPARGQFSIAIVYSWATSPIVEDKSFSGVIGHISPTSYRIFETSWDGYSTGFRPVMNITYTVGGVPPSSPPPPSNSSIETAVMPYSRLVSVFPDLLRSCAAVGEFDHDAGDDVFITGFDASGNEYSRVFLYYPAMDSYVPQPDITDGNVTYSYDTCQASVTDWDKDGWDDIVVIGRRRFDNNDVMDVFINDGTGSFSAPSLTYDLSDCGVPTLDFQNTTLMMRMGDVDSNGYADFLVFGLPVNDTIFFPMLFMDTETSITCDLTRTQELHVSGNPSTFTFIDADKDGYLDVIRENLLYLFDGDAYLPSVTFSPNVTGTSTDAYAYDVTGDSRPDVVMTDISGASCRTYLVVNNQTDSVMDEGDFYYSDNSPFAASYGYMLGGDMNLNGHPDILQSGIDLCDGGRPKAYKFEVIDGKFSAELMPFPGVDGTVSPVSAALYDADGDGDLDILSDGSAPMLFTNISYYDNGILSPYMTSPNPLLTFSGMLVDVNDTSRGLLPEIGDGMMEFVKAIGVRGLTFWYAMVGIMLAVAIMGFVAAVIRGRLR